MLFVRIFWVLSLFKRVFLAIRLPAISGQLLGALPHVVGYMLFVVIVQRPL